MRHFSFAFLLLFCFSAVCGQVADSLSVDDLLASGKKMERELRYAEALCVYQQCAERDTANLDAALSLADVASTLGLADVAERTYRRILLRDTANFYARYRLPGSTRKCAVLQTDDAFFRGYQVVVPRDCVRATGPREQESSLWDIETHFGAVTDSDAVLARL